MIEDSAAIRAIMVQAGVVIRAVKTGKEDMRMIGTVIKGPLKEIDGPHGKIVMMIIATEGIADKIARYN